MLASIFTSPEGNRPHVPIGNGSISPCKAQFCPPGLCVSSSQTATGSVGGSATSIGPQRHRLRADRLSDAPVAWGDYDNGGELTDEEENTVTADEVDVAPDGVVDVYAVLVSSLDSTSLGPMMAFYDILTARHLVAPDNIHYLLID